MRQRLKCNSALKTDCRQTEKVKGTSQKGLSRGSDAGTQSCLE